MFFAKDISLPGADGLPIGLDIFFVGEERPKPVFIYAHGFNGFKNWGNFDLMAEQICAAGMVLVKFNFHIMEPVSNHLNLLQTLKHSETTITLNNSLT